MDKEADKLFNAFAEYRDHIARLEHEMEALRQFKEEVLMGRKSNDYAVAIDLNDELLLQTSWMSLSSARQYLEQIEGHAFQYTDKYMIVRRIV